MKIDAYEHVTPLTLTVKAKPGVTLFSCQIEMVKIAADQSVDVRLIHNSREYLVNYTTLLNQIVEVDLAIDAENIE